jgi:hypothetical protein
MARLGQPPMELRSFEITDVDVYLHLQGGAVLRVEISSLPARVQGPPTDDSRPPEVTQAQAPEPVKASKGKAAKTPRR